MYPFISLFNKIEIPVYGIVFVVAFFLAILIAIKYAPSMGLSKMDTLFGAVYAGIGILIGSKILYFITKLPFIIKHFDNYMKYLKHYPIDALNYAFGGLVFYGGLIGALLFILIYCRQFKLSFLTYMDVFAPLIPFVHGFGRIGCFLSGCCYGIEYNGIFSIQYPYNALIPELNEVQRFPVQLLEALLNFLVAAILFLLMKIKKMKPGQLLGIYLLYYTFARYFLEMLRGDIIRGKVGSFSTSQLISILLLPLAILFISGKLKQKNSKL